MNCKKIVSFIAIVMILFGESKAEQVYMQPDSIKQKRRDIQYMMTRDCYISYALMGFTAAQYIYPVAVSFCQPDLPEIASVSNKRDFLRLHMVYASCPWMTVQKKVSFFRAIKNSIRAIKNSMEYRFCTKEGWDSIISLGLSCALSVMTAKVLDNFYHADTLSWYVRTHASYAVTLEMMQSYRCYISSQQACDPGKEFDKAEQDKTIRDMYTRLAHQAELICAFMMYKKNYFEDEERVVAVHAIRSFYRAQKKWLSRIAVVVHADVIDHERLLGMLMLYERDIEAHLTHFAVIEGDIRHLKKMKNKKSE